jgi:tetratricopeptide (TPR) repeat protein
MGVLVILVALLVALARAWWREPARFALPLLGISWFCLALVPLVAAVPQIGFYGNRYAYSPLGGLTVAAVGLLEPLAGRARGRLSRLWLAAGVALPAMLVLSTLSEAANWSSDLSLYQADLLRDPDNGIAHYHYGYAVLRRRGCSEALPIFLAATRLAPGYARGWHNVAGCLENLGRAAQAVEPARRAVELEPDNARNQYNLAVALAARGNRTGAMRALEECLAREPSFKPAPELLVELGRVQSQP